MTERKSNRCRGIFFVQLQSVVSILVCLYTTVSGVVTRGQERVNIRICFFPLNFAAVGKLSENAFD